MQSNGQIKTQNNMQELALFIPILSVIGIVLVIIYLRRYSNIERMAMIEKGINRGEWWGGETNSSIALRLALFFLGIGCGFLMGEVLRELTGFREPICYFSMLFIFGGAGLFASYVIEEKKNKKKLQ